MALIQVRQVVIGLVALSFLSAIFYFSLRSSPNLSEIAWLPGWLTAWADSRAGEDIRTAIPFFALGGLVGLLARSRRGVVFGVFVCVALPFVVEGLQMGIPTRTASMQDVGWGILGAVVGLAGGQLFCRGWWRVAPLQ